MPLYTVLIKFFIYKNWLDVILTYVVNLVFAVNFIWYLSRFFRIAFNTRVIKWGFDINQLKKLFFSIVLYLVGF